MKENEASEIEIGGEEWSVAMNKLHCIICDILKLNINKTCFTMRTQVRISSLLKCFVIQHYT